MTSYTCDECGCQDNHVVDSRPSTEHGVIRRRRKCGKCGERWTTYEVRLPVRKTILHLTMGMAIVAVPQDEWLDMQRAYSRMVADAVKNQTYRGR